MKQQLYATMMLAFVLTSCTGSREQRVIGVIDFYGDGTTNVLDVPDIVQAGQTFTVTIKTFGDDCTRVADDQITTQGMTATITVYDFIAKGGCTTQLNRPKHTVNLQFDSPGIAQIRVVGRRVGPETGDEEQLRTIKKSITVE